MTKLTGIYTAIVTPFNAEGKLDENGLRENLSFQIANGVDGITALGTTGESPTLSAEEKERIIRIAVEETKGKVHLMIGTGSYSTEQAIQNTCQAQELGADSALVITPYYNKPTQEGIYQHFSAIAAAVDIPIIIYNHPGRSGQNILPETMERLAKHPNIIGVKEASGSLAQATEILEKIPEFSVLSGDDSLTLPLIALGGHGVVSVIGNLVPKEMKSLVSYALHNDYDAARAVHYELLPLFRLSNIETNPIPIKAAMNLLGMAAGSCRLPLCDLTPENQSKLEEIMEPCYG